MVKLGNLPIDVVQTQFMSALQHHHVVVESDTGSGKSTRLPLWCAQFLSQKNQSKVLVIEPRRVACIALADFVSQQTHLNVGYCIRFESTIEADTDIAFVTPGVALRWLSSTDDVDTHITMQDFAIVMIDEFHERRWDTDLLLAILKQRHSHRLVVTSATINAAKICQYLQDDHQSVCHLLAQGKRFHVELRYLARESHYLPSIEGLEGRVYTAVASLLIETQGDILVFLPGKREIQLCMQLCQRLAQDNAALQCIGLHGGINISEQQLALTEISQQRIIFATNVAETSLTIPGVTAVVDSGLERRTMQRNGRTVLSLQAISQASSEQRLGRAGRIQAGVCIRLWGANAPLIKLTPADLQREDLVEPMLAAATVSTTLQQLHFLEPIPDKSVLSATDRLLSMGAIDSQGSITAHGRRLFPLPIDTQFAHLIAAMPDDISRELMIDLAAGLSVAGRLYQLPKGEYELTRLKQWEPFGCDGYLLIKLIRGGKLDELTVDATLLEEAKLLSRQISSAIGIADPTAACRNMNLLSHQNIRANWLLSVMKAMPDMAFIRRAKRQQALGNGYSEVQIARDSRFDLLGATDTQPQAAIVFDQFSLPGKGSKQTINLATCMAPITLTHLAAAHLGTTRLNLDGSLSHQGLVTVERVFSGRVIDSWQQAAEPEQVISTIVKQIETEVIFPGLFPQLQIDINAWNIYVALGLAEPEALPIEVSRYLPEKLQALGVETLDDIELIDCQDLRFDGIPDWQRQEFDEKYPLNLALADLKLRVEYIATSKRIIVHYADGGRKAGPKRWELPVWKGWRISYRKASRVVEVN
ncbi:ATP-dependent RNA helicase [Shewanella sp. Scap07]|nr:ATP-dependent RNA helicase [Shewanella sp. Scap07]